MYEDQSKLVKKLQKAGRQNTAFGRNHIFNKEFQISKKITFLVKI